MRRDKYCCCSFCSTRVLLGMGHPTGNVFFTHDMEWKSNFEREFDLIFRKFPCRRFGSRILTVECRFSIHNCKQFV